VFESLPKKPVNAVGIHLKWEGSEVYETGTDSSTGKIIVRIDPNYFRPTEVDLLFGDASKAKAKAKAKLGWSPSCNLD
jgi:GDPmannose 4,6-dehydratase